MKKGISSFGFMAMALSSMAADMPSARDYIPEGKEPVPFDEEKNRRIIKATEENYQPPGTQLFCFNAEGEMKNSMLKTECVFNCYAINEKNARRKYANYKKQNS